MGMLGKTYWRISRDINGVETSLLIFKGLYIVKMKSIVSARNGGRYGTKASGFIVAGQPDIKSGASKCQDSWVIEDSNKLTGIIN
jgi:hypothetical protein